MVYHKPIYPISPCTLVLSFLSSTLQDRGLSYTVCQPGGEPYGIDTRRAEGEFPLKPQDN